MVRHSRCPFLYKHWCDEEDGETFNAFARTLVRFGIVDYMLMEAQMSRYVVGIDEEGTHDYDEYINVTVGVVVGDKSEAYEIYEGFY